MGLCLGVCRFVFAFYCLCVIEPLIRILLTISCTSDRLDFGLNFVSRFHILRFASASSVGSVMTAAACVMMFRQCQLLFSLIRMCEQSG